MEKLVKLLKAKGLNIASVESLTGGLFSAKIAEVSGASAVLVGSIVTYQTRIKEEIVHVNHDVILEYGVVSKEVAYEMAFNGAELLDADICVSFSGNAGPSVMENKQVGEVYCGLFCLGKMYTFSFMLKGTRNEIREEVVEKMKKNIIMIVEKLK
ncbi:MAG: CinA family protein [Erysipelotrichaceae bacterium]